MRSLKLVKDKFVVIRYALLDYRADYGGKADLMELHRLATDTRMEAVWQALESHARKDWQERFPIAIHMAIMRATKSVKTKKEQVRSYAICAQAARRLAQKLRVEGEDWSVHHFLPDGLPKTGILGRMPLRPMLSEVVNEYATLMDQQISTTTLDRVMPRPHRKHAKRDAFIRAVGDDIFRETNQSMPTVIATISSVALADSSISPEVVKECMRTYKGVSV